jgi:hypothetical protein
VRFGHALSVGNVAGRNGLRLQSAQGECWYLYAIGPARANIPNAGRLIFDHEGSPLLVMGGFATWNWKAT